MADVNPSWVSSHYPTSSSALPQHSCIRLLWLPLVTCLHMTGERPRLQGGSSLPTLSPRVANISFAHSASRAAALAASEADDSSSGFEMQLKYRFVHHDPIPMRELRGAFPNACPHYVDSASLRFLVGDDFGSSQWENMDVYRSIEAVVVVLNAASLGVTPAHAASVVKTVFQAQFKEKVCRCYVVNPTPETASILTSSRMFVSVSTQMPLEETAHTAMHEIALSVVNQLNLTLYSYANVTKVDRATLRTPLDRQGSLETLKANQLQSRVSKKRGDILLLLGAVDEALRVYGETQFGSNADWLWCSATVESIAAARYQQFRSLLLQLPALNDTLLLLQSDATQWGDTLTARVDQLEKGMASMVEGVRRALAAFKGTSVPQSMRQRLVRSVDEPLTAKAATLKVLFARVRACIAAQTTELPDDPLAGRVGFELKQCVEEMVRIACTEEDVYLKESLRQLRKAAASGGSGAANVLRERELEARLQLVSFLAEIGDFSHYVEEMNGLRDTFTSIYGEVQQRGLQYFALLCLRCGCRRKAIACLTELAQMGRAAKSFTLAVRSLVRACVLSGIDVNISELSGDCSTDLLFQLFQAMENRSWANSALLTRTLNDDGSFSAYSEDWTTTQAGSSHVKGRDEDATAAGGGVCGRRIELHVPLLMSLMDLLDEAGCRGGIRCRLATLLLFRYPDFLDRETQESLFATADRDAMYLEPHMPPTTAELPFLLSWEALPLPPHLAPKTVSVGGPLFTFIDTQRLKLTVLSLNGKKLNSRVVWTVGDVATVLVMLYNPFRLPLHIRAVALQCRSCAALDERNNVPEGSASHCVGPLAPISYVLHEVIIPPRAKQQVQLYVQPTMEGYLRIEGVELRLKQLRATMPFEGQLSEPLGIPVLPRLPLVSCSVSVSELEIFGGQRAEFWVRVVNCGLGPIEHISLTAHSETCQLEDCEGCMERASKKEASVTLSKAALDAADSAPLQPGDVVNIPVKLQAPTTIDTLSSHFVVFRVDCSLPHEKPTMPPNVPNAVPVFGVIPRRVMETRMRLFHAPSLAVTSIALTKDRRFVDIRVANRSQRYSVEMHLSSLRFADLPDALLVAGAEYVVPPIAITSIPVGTYAYSVPWVVRELPHCAGAVELDLSVVASEGVCAEPLDECLVCVDVEIPPTIAAGEVALPTRRHWESRPSNSAGAHVGTPVDRNDSLCESLSSVAAGVTVQGQFNTTGEAEPTSPAGKPAPIVIPAVKPVLLHLRASARWRRAVPIRVRVSMDYHVDVGMLTGPVDCTELVGDHGKVVYGRSFELFAFKTGEHVITITLSDQQEREITHLLHVAVQHSHQG